VVLSKLWELGSFCLVLILLAIFKKYLLMLILLAIFKKYLLNAFAISWRSLIEFPSRFKVSIFSVLPVL